jgi:Ca-activated chloride channel family protein
MHIPFLSSEYIFARPEWLLALLLLPLLAIWRSKHGRTPAVRFSGASLLSGLGSPARSTWGRFFFGLVLASMAAAIIGIARPQKAVSFDEEKTEGIAIMLTVDVSLSMRIQDFYISGIPVNRLTAAKRVMQDFIAGRATDRIGITAFAGAPYVPCPLTLDHDWLQTNIERVQTGVMEDGTAIGSGLAAAARRLDDQKVPSKVIILLTDGANNSGKLSPQDAAKLAVTLGIKIYTIAIGTPGVHMIPLEDGRIITSGRQEFDEQTLREVARLGSGQFYMAQDLSALAKIFKTIDDLEKVEIKRKTYIEVSELFHWFVAIAVGLLLLALLLNQTLLRTAPSPAST